MATILCIEDEEALLDDISELMEASGHNVIKAMDGQEGLESILQYKPDLVISDISMPRKNGKELLNEIRTKYDAYEDMPFILLSALTSREDILEGMDFGADDYLTKPVDYELLERKVNARLREVERIKKKSDEALLKMFKAMTHNDIPATPVTPPTKTPPPQKTDGGVVGAGTARRKTEQDSQGVNSAKQEQKSQTKVTKKKKVYGSKVGVKPSKKIKKLPKKSQQSIGRWLESNVTNFINNLFPGKAVMTKSGDGDVIVCYVDGDMAKADQKTSQLVSSVGKKFVEEKVPELKKEGKIPEEDILELTVIAKEPYELEVELEHGDSDSIKSAIKSQVTMAETNKLTSVSSANEFIDVMEQQSSSLVILKMLDQKMRELPIKIYNFSEKDRELISSSFKKFQSDELSEAECKLDLLFLKLLFKQSSSEQKSKIVVVDVHYNTINSKAYRSSYIPVLRGYTQNSKAKLVLNIRRIPSGVDMKKLKENLKPLAQSIKSITAQLAPHEFKSFIKSPLPVSGLICSYMSTQFEGFEANLLKQVKAALPNSNIPLIVRGVPSEEGVAYLSKLGFTGFAIGVK